MKDFNKKINLSSIGDRLKFLHILFEKSVHIREDAWFHYKDGLPYEIKDYDTLVLLGNLLKEMSENKGKLKNEN